MALKDHYPKSYAASAWNQTGIAPDYSRCCKSVYKQDHHGSLQCSRKNGHGPDGAYCKTHDPKAAQKRQELSDYNYRAKYYQSSINRLYGADKVIRAIAEGHKNPRQLAQEWLDKMDDLLTPPEKPSEEA